MNIQLKVPTIACGVCAETITKAIQKQQPDSQVAVDIETKKVTIETEATVEIIKNIITSVGHEVD